MKISVLAFYLLIINLINVSHGFLTIKENVPINITQCQSDVGSYVVSLIKGEMWALKSK